jgi:outer membrane assembly lipoprotein YfiO
MTQDKPKMNRFLVAFAMAALIATLITTVGCGRDPYDNPIANNSEQPDKILFDKSIRDIEKHRYDLARLTLNTLINTYPDSEYIAKAKLAVADSWYREGSSHALAQAEAEYKDFITFFPSMEESAESQMKICRIHFEQMHKADRDNTHSLKADQECRQMLMQYPNSTFVDGTKQMLHWNPNQHEVAVIRIDRECSQAWQQLFVGEQVPEAQGDERYTHHRQVCWSPERKRRERACGQGDQELGKISRRRGMSDEQPTTTKGDRAAHDVVDRVAPKDSYVVS